jgi:hypothetical protein
MSRSWRLPRARRPALRCRTIAIAALPPHQTLRRNLGQSTMRSLDLPYSGLRSPAPAARSRDRTALIIVPALRRATNWLRGRSSAITRSAILTVTASATRGEATPRRDNCLRFLPFQYFDSTATVRRVFGWNPTTSKADRFRWIQTY